MEINRNTPLHELIDLLGATVACRFADGTLAWAKLSRFEIDLEEHTDRAIIKATISHDPPFLHEGVLISNIVVGISDLTMANWVTSGGRVVNRILNYSHKQALSGGQS